MTPQEHECCRQMLEMCGSPHMPTSHSCCKEDVEENQSSLVVTDEQQSAPLQVLGSLPAIASPFFSEWLHQNVSQQPLTEFQPDTTILRI